MGLESNWSREQWQAELHARAEQLWGAERRVALESHLDSTATALWHLARAPLEPLEAEPDFVAGLRQQERAR
jgi:hypothetical protein